MQTAVIEAPLCRLCDGNACLPLFGVRDLNRRTDGEIFRYFKCERCSSIRLGNPPTDLARYYGVDYHQLPETASALLRKSTFDQYKIDILRRFVASGRMLEIGAGEGGFSYRAKLAGFDVSVIENSERARTFVRDTLHIKVLDQPETLENDDIGEFDVIALWHVLEHIDRVNEFLDNVGKRLKPGGCLILAMPNPRSVQFRIFGRYWVHLDAPRHLNLLPASSLAAALQHRGLELAWQSYADRGTRYWNSFGWLRSFRNLPLPEPVAVLGLVAGYGLAALSRILGRFDCSRSAYTMVVRRRA